MVVGDRNVPPPVCVGGQECPPSVGKKEPPGLKGSGAGGAGEL